jgi:hypothetical protein
MYAILETGAAFSGIPEAPALAPRLVASLGFGQTTR